MFPGIIYKQGLVPLEWSMYWALQLFSSGLSLIKGIFVSKCGAANDGGRPKVQDCHESYVKSSQNNSRRRWVSTVSTLNLPLSISREYRLRLHQRIPLGSHLRKPI